MDPEALKTMILKALRGSLLTGLAATGCGYESSIGPKDAGTGTAGKTAAAAGVGGKWNAAQAGDGTAGVGGKPVGMVEAGAGGQRVLPANCFDSGVGVCCRDDVCFDRPRLRGQGGAGGLSSADAGDDDAGLTATCPARWPSAGTCVNYSDLVSQTDDKCCYVRTAGTCCGRPFLVGDRALRATLRASADWAGGYAVLTERIDPGTRDHLARAWLEDARLEHASIASFARFTLQALSLGAPADLIMDAQCAALDEVEHARACFALASRYLAAPIGPGEFPMDGGLVACTLAQAAAATVREGCVAETVAALQARAQLMHATDAEVRAALIRIARDEARHAELAWRFVHWAMNSGGALVRDAVTEAFREALLGLRAEPLRPLGEVALETWHAHGRLTPIEERSCWRQAAQDVIEPCARALLQT